MANKKLTEVPLAPDGTTDARLIVESGGSILRMEASALGTGDAVPYVAALAPEGSGTAYRVVDSRVTLDEGSAFHVLFPDSLAPTRSYVSLSVNSVDCPLYWKGENISLMAETLGHAFTREAGYVHFAVADGRLELCGVDTIASGSRLYTSPGEYIEQAWVEA